MIRRRLVISGEVQGVGFRAATRRMAEIHPQVSGYVRNLPDGRVEAVFQGPKDAVQSLIAWCRRGPATANVTDIEIHQEVPKQASTGFLVDSE